MTRECIHSPLDLSHGAPPDSRTVFFTGWPVDRWNFVCHPHCLCAASLQTESRFNRSAFLWLWESFCMWPAHAVRSRVRSLITQWAKWFCHFSAIDELSVRHHWHLHKNLKSVNSKLDNYIKILSDINYMQCYFHIHIKTFANMHQSGISWPSVLQWFNSLNLLQCHFSKDSISPSACIIYLIQNNQITFKKGFSQRHKGVLASVL